MVFNQNNREKALDGVDGCACRGRVPEPDDEAGWNRVWLAGEMMVVVGRETAEADEVGREVLPTPELRGQLVALLEGGRLAPRQRAEAGDALGRSATRGRRLHPASRRCYRHPRRAVPDGRRDRDEIQLESFAIARYPVTNAQFRTLRRGRRLHGEMARLLDETRAGTLPARRRAGRSLVTGRMPFRSIDNKPVVGVSWYEAVAYANWLGRVDRPGLPPADRGGVGAGRPPHRRPGMALGRRVAGWDRQQR